MPLTGQSVEEVTHWYRQTPLTVGLIIPIKQGNRILLDCIDRVDFDSVQTRFRTNIYGWFSPSEIVKSDRDVMLLKPTKKTLSSACAGHNWHENGPCRPIIPSLRELLLSCTINWKNLKKAQPPKS